MDGACAAGWRRLEAMRHLFWTRRGKEVTPLRIGTRGSALALWQANHVREALDETCGVESEIVVVKTSGDD